MKFLLRAFTIILVICSTIPYEDWKFQFVGGYVGSGDDINMNYQITKSNTLIPPEDFIEDDHLCQFYSASNSALGLAEGNPHSFYINEKEVLDREDPSQRVFGNTGSCLYAHFVAASIIDQLDHNSLGLSDPEKTAAYINDDYKKNSMRNALTYTKKRYNELIYQAILKFEAQAPPEYIYGLGRPEGAKKAIDDFIQKRAEEIIKDKLEKQRLAEQKAAPKQIDEGITKNAESQIREELASLDQVTEDETAQPDDENSSAALIDEIKVKPTPAANAKVSLNFEESVHESSASLSQSQVVSVETTEGNDRQKSSSVLALISSPNLKDEKNSKPEPTLIGGSIFIKDFHNSNSAISAEKLKSSLPDIRLVKQAITNIYAAERRRIEEHAKLVRLTKDRLHGNANFSSAKLIQEKNVNAKGKKEIAFYQFGRTSALHFVKVFACKMDENNKVVPNKDRFFYEVSYDVSNIYNKGAKPKSDIKSHELSSSKPESDFYIAKDAKEDDLVVLINSEILEKLPLSFIVLLVNLSIQRMTEYDPPEMLKNIGVKFLEYTSFASKSAIVIENRLNNNVNLQLGEIKQKTRGKVQIDLTQPDCYFQFPLKKTFQQAGNLFSNKSGVDSEVYDCLKLNYGFSSNNIRDLKDPDANPIFGRKMAELIFEIFDFKGLKPEKPKTAKELKELKKQKEVISKTTKPKYVPGNKDYIPTKEDPQETQKTKVSNQSVSSDTLSEGSPKAIPSREKWLLKHSKRYTAVQVVYPKEKGPEAIEKYYKTSISDFVWLQDQFAIAAAVLTKNENELASIREPLPEGDIQEIIISRMVSFIHKLKPDPLLMRIEQIKDEIEIKMKKDEEIEIKKEEETKKAASKPKTDEEAENIMIEKVAKSSYLTEEQKQQLEAKKKADEQSKDVAAESATKVNTETPSQKITPKPVEIQTTVVIPEELFAEDSVANRSVEEEQSSATPQISASESSIPDTATGSSIPQEQANETEKSFRRQNTSITDEDDEKENHDDTDEEESPKKGVSASLSRDQATKEMDRRIAHEASEKRFEGRNFIKGPDGKLKAIGASKSLMKLTKLAEIRLEKALETRAALKERSKINKPRVENYKLKSQLSQSKVVSSDKRTPYVLRQVEQPLKALEEESHTIKILV